MKVNQAEITISAVSPAQYPNEGLPEIALAGRSNVGKSSYINSLINRKKLARTSSKPGKTRTINFYKIENKFFFVDVPGYGYAKVSKTEREKWGEMMNTYFSQREPLALTVLVVDFRHVPTSDDIQMYEFLKYFELPVLVVATKSDKISPSKKNKHTQQIKKAFNFNESDHFVVFSTEKNEGKAESWKIIESYLK
ncbi:ribosome biogenesis GTP-binding protein YihA/YsxC [Lacticigenium naphthae]|uniref:ribosome biogenesis GTP-binding protein YihA/YsxC n=1 Tax=Lacticigenium naphthae TaxID=515351 RepID=UPI00040800DC|nr:ribosome biogenesis GTP-binding protein YihA/YsxC [Lacticigenium naphthae]